MSLQVDPAPGEPQQQQQQQPPLRRESSTPQTLTSMNEGTWIQIGRLAELMDDPDKALVSYEAALRNNPFSVQALKQSASIYRAKEQHGKAIEYLQRLVHQGISDSEIWGSLGHCYLLMDDMHKAFSAFQQALYHSQDTKEPKLWYGIGILYDRYGNFEHAEEAFQAVLRMDPKFEKWQEIYFRLGIINKHQQKYDLALDHLQRVLQSPPKPLTEADIWFQIGHIYELCKQYDEAKEAYKRVVDRNPHHSKVLQQLGWLYHQPGAANNGDQDIAIKYLEQSREVDPNDAQTYYLLGRCYMTQQNYNKAYESYQQAVYRDGRNPAFWCSIGVLYYQINQYRDALDAYSRAIRLNPYISEVWYDLGALYESCNNQVQDAIDAYARAAEMDPSNTRVRARLNWLQQQQASGGPSSATEPPVPVPQEMSLAVSYPNNGTLVQPQTQTQSQSPMTRSFQDSARPHIAPIVNGDTRSNASRDSHSRSASSSGSERLAVNTAVSKSRTMTPPLIVANTSLANAAPKTVRTLLGETTAAAMALQEESFLPTKLHLHSMRQQKLADKANDNRDRSQRQSPQNESQSNNNKQHNKHHQQQQQEKQQQQQQREGTSADSSKPSSPTVTNEQTNISINAISNLLKLKRGAAGETDASSASAVDSNEAQTNTKSEVAREKRTRLSSS